MLCTLTTAGLQRVHLYTHVRLKRRGTPFNKYYLHWSGTQSIDPGLYTRISSVVWKKVIAGAQRAGFLNLPRHSMEHACSSIQRAQQRSTMDFNWRVCKGPEKIRTDFYVSFDVLDYVTKTSNLEYVAHGPYRVLKQDKVNVVLQQRKPNGRTRAEKIALFPLSAAMPLIPLMSALSINSQDNNLKRKPSLLHEIADYYMNHDDQLEFF